MTDDVITQPVRERFIAWTYRRQGEFYLDDPTPGDWDRWAREDPTAPKLATLVTCRWCAGAWLSAGVVVARRVAPRAWRPVSEVLTASAVAALLAKLED